MTVRSREKHKWLRSIPREIRRALIKDGQRIGKPIYLDASYLTWDITPFREADDLATRVRWRILSGL